eukprot:1259804-Pleurochrysis_carterae.AAC.1
MVMCKLINGVHACKSVDEYMLMGLWICEHMLMGFRARRRCALDARLPNSRDRFCNKLKLKRAFAWKSDAVGRVKKRS